MKFESQSTTNFPHLKEKLNYLCATFGIQHQYCVIVIVNHPFRILID